MRSLTVLAVLLVGVFSTGVAHSFECDGKYVVVRKSAIIEGGSMDGFKSAVKDHIAWYRANGVSDNDQVISPVLMVDNDKQEITVSDTEVMTFHVNPPHLRDISLPAHGDDAWKAFVDKYRKNSKIVEETVTCWPKKSD